MVAPGESVAHYVATALCHDDWTCAVTSTATNGSMWQQLNFISMQQRPDDVLVTFVADGAEAMACGEIALNDTLHYTITLRFRHRQILVFTGDLTLSPCGDHELFKKTLTNDERTSELQLIFRRDTLRLHAIEWLNRLSRFEQYIVKIYFTTIARLCMKRAASRNALLRHSAKTCGASSRASFLPRCRDMVS